MSYVRGLNARSCASELPRVPPKRLRRAGALVLLCAGVLLAQGIFAQASPHVKSVEPAAGKVNDAVTLTGANLGKDVVAAVFLSDDAEDHKAALVEQAAEKIVLKVPDVKPGPYNIAIQVGDKILILPMRFHVE